MLDRRAIPTAAAAMLLLAGVSAPALAASAGVEQFMMSQPVDEPLEPGTPAVDEATPARASDASLVSLRYRERSRDTRGGRTIIVTRHDVPPLESVHYRPRSRSSARPAVYGGSTQLHAGFFDPDGDAERGILFGFRAGPRVDEHVQIGVGLDWRHRTQSYTELLGTTTGPGGEQIDIRRELSRSTSDWLPLQGFVELNAGTDMTVIPYFGLSGGYQWLGITGDDYADGSAFDATFGGWGWQGYGGVALPLGPRSRLNAEVFVNGSELNRDSVDAFTGENVRETINMDGIGMRFGLSWGFF
jgi:hypothetical protein